MSLRSRLFCLLAFAALALASTPSRADSYSSCQPYSATHMVCTVFIYDPGTGSYLPSQTYFVPLRDIYIDP